MKFMANIEFNKACLASQYHMWFQGETPILICYGVCIMKIYIVDDESAVLAYLNEELQLALNELKIEADIVSFKFPTALLEQARIAPPDIVFLDIEMPVMNGIELARELMNIKNNINIIFATGYGEYAIDALNLYASGYILKPSDKDQIIKSLMHLRFAVSDDKPVKIITFGNFDVFVNGTPVKFRSQKSKELLAFLVDRQGASITRKEAAAILYEDQDYTRYVQKSLCRIANYLAEDMEKAGASNIFVNGEGSYSILLNNTDCDLIEYNKDPNSVKVTGEYMEQYSWGEYRKGMFL